MESTPRVSEIAHMRDQPFRFVSFFSPNSLHYLVRIIGFGVIPLDKEN